MTTAASDPEIVLRESAAAPALRAADQGVADALTSVLSDNTRRVYAAQWRLFTNWCDSVGQSVPYCELFGGRSRYSTTQGECCKSLPTHGQRPKVRPARNR